MHSRAARQEAGHLADRLLGRMRCPPNQGGGALAGLDRARLPTHCVRPTAARDRGIKNPVRAALDVARPASGGAGHDYRRCGARRTPPTGRRERDGTQHHHQVAHDLRRRLDGAIERISLVDDVLAPSGFLEMDFPTRNLYRSAIEELARGSKRSEIDIARRAVVERSRLHVPGRAWWTTATERSRLSSPSRRSRRV